MSVVGPMALPGVPVQLRWLMRTLVRSVYFPTHELGEGLNYISIHADDNIVVRRVQKNN